MVVYICSDVKAESVKALLSYVEDYKALTCFYLSHDQTV